MTLLDEWVHKAEGGYKMAVILNRPRQEPQPDGVCYHCQQSAEKYLKAYLIMQGAVPQRTHDLRDLLKECATYDASLSVLMLLVRLLNPYSVRFRYPGDDATVARGKDGSCYATKSAANPATQVGVIKDALSGNCFEKPRLVNLDTSGSKL